MLWCGHRDGTGWGRHYSLAEAKAEGRVAGHEEAEAGLVVAD